MLDGNLPPPAAGYHGSDPVVAVVVATVVAPGSAAVADAVTTLPGCPPHCILP